MFSSTTLVCIVDLKCIVDHMCLLACKVRGGITAVAFSCCRILHLTLCGSTSGPTWYPSCPAISGKLPSSGLLHYLWFISVRVGHLSAVFTPSRYCFYSTESIFYFSAACPIYPAKVSHYYRRTSVDTTSVHIVKRITKNIHNDSSRWGSSLDQISTPPTKLEKKMNSLLYTPKRIVRHKIGISPIQWLGCSSDEEPVSQSYNGWLKFATPVVARPSTAVPKKTKR